MREEEIEGEREKRERGRFVQIFHGERYPYKWLMPETPQKTFTSIEVGISLSSLG